MTVLPPEPSPTGSPRDHARDRFDPIAPLADARDVAEFELRLAEAALAPGLLALRVVHVLRWVPGPRTFVRHTWVRGENDGGAVRPRARSVPAERGRGPRDREAALDAIVGQAWTSGRAVRGEAVGSRVPTRTLGAVPLGRPDAGFGVIAGEWDPLDTPADVEAALLRFAEEAMRAFAGFRRGYEAGRRAEQAAALEEMARAAVTPRNVAEIFHLAVRAAVRGTGADGGIVWTREGGAPRIVAAHGAPATRERVGQGLGAIAAEVAESLRPQVVPSPQDDLRVPADAAAAIAGCAVWPLAAYGRARGAVAVYAESRSAAGFPFERGDREFLGALADLVALAADHADRTAELRDLERRERETRAELRRAERLASLGDVAAQAAREAAVPVATIRAFVSRALRAEGGEAARECLEVVLREVGRLERVLEEQRAHAEVEPPSLRLGSLNDTVQDGLQGVGEVLVRRRVRLVKKLAPDLPLLLLDARRIGQAVDNLVRFALDSVGIGGRVRLETRRAANHVVLELAHDGARAAGDVLEQLFVPFSASRPGGLAVGLGVAQRIVQEHGGEIRVRADGEWSTVISFTLPVAGNQDRRKTPVDRRRVRQDRRSGPTAA